MASSGKRVASDNEEESDGDDAPDAEGGDGDVSVTSCTERKRSKRRRLAKRAMPLSEAQQRAEFDKRSEKTEQTVQLQSAVDETKRTDLGDVLRKAGVSSTKPLTVRRMDQLRAERPNAFDPHAADATPPEYAVSRGSSSEFRIEAVQSLIGSIKRCHPIRLDRPLSASASASASAAAAAAATDDTPSLKELGESPSGISPLIAKQRNDQRALLIGGVYQPPLFEAPHIANLIEEGGSYTTTDGRKYKFPVCSAGAKCIVQQYRHVIPVAADAKDSKTNAPWSDNPLTQWRLKSCLTFSEHAKCERGELCDVSRPCVVCLSDALLEVIIDLKNPNAGARPVPVTLDKYIALQPYYVKTNQIGGFHVHYTNQLSHEYAAAGPAPIVDFDLSKLTMEPMKDGSGRRRLNIHQMVFRTEMQHRQPRPGSSDEKMRNQLMQARRDAAALAAKQRAAATDTKGMPPPPPKKPTTNFKNANKAPKPPTRKEDEGLDGESELFGLVPASVESVLTEARAFVKSRATPVRKQPVQRTDRDAVRKAIDEHYERATNSQALQQVREAAPVVETLFANAIRFQRWAYCMSTHTRAVVERRVIPLDLRVHTLKYIQFIRHPFFSTYLPRFISEVDRDGWRDPKCPPELQHIRNINPCRFSHLKTRTVSEPTRRALMERCRDCKRRVLDSPNLYQTLWTILRECDPTGSSAATTDTKALANRRPFVEALPDRLFLSILRMCLLYEWNRRSNVLYSLFRTLCDKDPTDERLQLCDELSRLIKSVVLVLDAYWFVPMALVLRWRQLTSTTTADTDRLRAQMKLYAPLEDVIDIHCDSTLVVSDRTQIFMREFTQMAFFMDDSSGKKFPFVHLFRKARPQRAQNRMMHSVLAKYIYHDVRFRSFACSLAMCSILGNYSHLPAHHLLPFSLRVLLYRQYYTTIGGGDWSFFRSLFSKSLDRFMMHACQMYMFYCTRSSPAFLRYCYNLFPFSELDGGTDALMQRFRVRLVQHAAGLWNVKRGEWDTPLASAYGTFAKESTTLCLASPYPKRCLGFLLKLYSFNKTIAVIPYKTMPQVLNDAAEHAGDADDADHNSSSSDEEENDDEEDDEDGGDTKRKAPLTEQEKAEKWELEEYNKHLKKAGIDTDDREEKKASRVFLKADSKVLLRHSTVESFGLSPEKVYAIHHIVQAIDPLDPFAERILLAIMRLFGSSETARSHVIRMMFLFESGQKIKPTMREFFKYYPSDYALLQTFSIFWRRHTSFRLFSLPAHYVVNQIKAQRIRFGLRDKSDILVEHGTQLLACPSCLRICTLIRDLAGRHHIFGKDGGYINVCVNLDPRLPDVVHYCTGNENICGIRCAKSPLVPIPILGKAMSYRGETSLVCPQPGCGVWSRVDPFRCQMTEFGYACSDCTTLLRLYSQEQEKRGYPGLVGGSTDGAVAVADTMGSSAAVAATTGEFADKGPKDRLAVKTRVTYVCDICNETVTRVTPVLILGQVITSCRKHKFKYIEYERNVSETQLTIKRNPECKEGACVCDSLVTTCDGTWNHASIVKLIRLKDGSDSNMLSDSAKLQKHLNPRANGKRPPPYKRKAATAAAVS